MTQWVSGWRYVVAASPMRPIEEEKKRTNKWKPKSESTTLASFGANVFSWRCTLRVEIYTSVRFAAEKKKPIYLPKSYLILLSVLMRIHWGMGLLEFCFLARTFLILKVLWAALTISGLEIYLILKNKQNNNAKLTILLTWFVDLSVFQNMSS